MMDGKDGSKGWRHCIKADKLSGNFDRWNRKKADKLSGNSTCKLNGSSFDESMGGSETVDNDSNADNEDRVTKSGQVVRYFLIKLVLIVANVKEVE